MTDQPPPETETEDTCRPVDIDGETIRVRGAGEISEQEHGYLAEIVRAAKAKFDAEPQPIRQQLRGHAFNAVAPALQRHEEWLRLTVRRTVADAVLTAIEDFLDIGDAEAWCKSCRRVWEGVDHRCESDAEQRLAKVRELRTDLHGITGARWIADALDTILDEPALDQTAPSPTAPDELAGAWTPDPPIGCLHITAAHDAGPSVAEATADDRVWPLQREGE